MEQQASPTTSYNDQSSQDSSSPPTPPLQQLHISGPSSGNSAGQAQPSCFGDQALLLRHRNPAWPVASCQFDRLPARFPAPRRSSTSKAAPTPRPTRAIRSHGGSPTASRRRRSKNSRKASQPYRSAPVSPTGSGRRSPVHPSALVAALRDSDISKHVREAVRDIMIITPMPDVTQAPTALAVADSEYHYVGAPAIPDMDPPFRLRLVLDNLDSSLRKDRCQRVLSRPASDEELLLCHTPGHVNVYGSATSTPARAAVLGYTMDRLVPKDQRAAAHAARLACGATIDAALAVATGQCLNAMVACRPAGHLAHSSQARGYCVFNNVAVAAKVCLQQPSVSRVMIVDIDHRHGAGTEEIFLHNPNVMVVSLHRYDDGHFFPHTGRVSDAGVGDGRGTNVNVAWHSTPTGMGDSEYLAAFRSIVLPLCVEFSPDIILISAGFDGCAYANLPQEYGGYHLSPAVYGYLIRMLMASVGGKVVVSLEGAADSTSSTACMSVCIRALLGDPLPMLPDPAELPNKACLDTLKEVVQVHSKYWKSLAESLSLANVAPNDYFKFQPVSLTGSKFCAPPTVLNPRRTSLPMTMAPPTIVETEAELIATNPALAALDEEDRSLIFSLTTLKYTAQHQHGLVMPEDDDEAASSQQQ
ncbi:HDAC9 protein [Salpingoeca rosetta]|uniref:histone deacetylase n=1 Tax=Salpingoeca rosetta (strain ATCC 50818 / BSB-021) TaxID=946362 RepID=F2USD8_SALR5|nr:HDAC9 protein [Salpingoeca rosetta]EGD81047.1 HDAC9 protein [Salpingoeca rosetta]|eukprot:XP_004987917.1 HDAC9 protein [Salpingoeca rosetta]